MGDSRKSRRGAIILSALVCPGVGQISVGRKKRGYVFISLTALTLVVLFVKIYSVVLQVMTPDMLMTLSVFDFLGAFVEIRSRIYSESVWILVFFIMVWATSLVDICVGKIEPSGIV